MSDVTQNGANSGVSRRKVLECMTWAGTGVLWTVSGGVPRSLGIIDGALAAEPSKLSFLQISDSHVGFDKPANPNVIGTLEEAVDEVPTSSPDGGALDRHGLRVQIANAQLTREQHAHELGRLRHEIADTKAGRDEAVSELESLKADR